MGVTGERLHIGPELALPLRYRGFWLEPAVAFEYTAYSINNPDPGMPDNPEAGAPVYSVDLGTVFERGARGGTGWLQTLEPRVQFVSIPFTDQSDLPVFDTIEPDFNMVQLYRKNRFLGYDRIGDTDQLNTCHHPLARCGQWHPVPCRDHRGDAIFQRTGRHAAGRDAS